jgi:hypothetical protein
MERKPVRPSDGASDQDWAAYYDAHHDRADEGELVLELPAEARPHGLATTITVRFPAEEAALIRRMAKETGASYSDIVRDAVRAYKQPVSRFRTK